MPKKRRDTADFGNLSTEIPQNAAWRAAEGSAADSVIAQANQLAVTLPSLDSIAVPTTEILSKGDSIGKYMIGEVLGKGGMGVVYAAFDPDLDRKIALKVLQPQSVADPETLRVRTLREAKLMAQISHPNVLTVYEVGTVGSKVFIAMEFVDGITLREWQGKPKRGWDEIVEVYKKAGQGLAAAHEVGLLHRDFKPENVMIDDAGRVRVLDFGMAAATDSLVTAIDDHKSAPEHRTPQQQTPLVRGSLTETGSVMGTPGYMSPEQHMGTSADARSDQFSFCVALYEALYGHRPFLGDTYFELAHNVMRGNLQAPPSGSGVPRRYLQVLQRGLARKMEDRFASLQELLAGLEEQPEKPPSRLVPILLTAAIAAVALAIGLYLFLAGGDSKSTACANSQDKLIGIWDSDSQAKAREAFESLESAFASASWLSVKEDVDAYTTEWVSARQEACQATQAKGGQNDRLLELRMVCLDDRLAEVEALVTLMHQSDRELVSGAQSAADALTPIAHCSALTSLMESPKTQEDRDAVAAVRGQLAGVKILTDAGRYEQAIVDVKNLAEAALAVDYPPLEAEYYLALGLAQLGTGKAQEASESLRKAGQIAQAAKYERLMLRAWIELVYVVGFDLSDSQGAMVWAQLAEGALGAGQGDERLKARLYNHMGAAYFQAEDYDKSVEYNLKGYEIRKRILPEDHPLVTKSMDYLGSGYLMQGKTSEALDMLNRALEIREQTLGPEHPMVAESHNNLGNAYYTLERYREALTHYQVALASWEAALGPDHPKVAVALTNIANLHLANERYSDALTNFRRVLQIDESTSTGNTLNVSEAHYNLGVVYSLMGKTEQALTEYEKAVRSAQKSGVGDNSHTATALQSYGELAWAQAKKTTALEAIEQAMDMRSKLRQRPEQLAENRFLLAQLIFEVRKDLDQALEMAGRAAEEYSQAGPNYQRELEQVQDWVSAHPK